MIKKTPMTLFGHPTKYDGWADELVAGSLVLPAGNVLETIADGSCGVARRESSLPHGLGVWLRFFAISRPAVLKQVLAGYRFHSAAKCVAANGPLDVGRANDPREDSVRLGWGRPGEV
jgi:hypothetical protein